MPFVVSGVQIKRQQPFLLNSQSHSKLRHTDEVHVYVFCFPCAGVYVRLFAFPSLKRTLESTSGLVSPPSSRSESLTTSLLNHPLISSTSFDVSRKFEQINIREYTTSTGCQPRQIGCESSAGHRRPKQQLHG